MSSLLQFNGNVSRKGVELQFYLVDKVQLAPNSFPDLMKNQDREPILCEKCGNVHPQLYVAWRKPAGMFGHQVVFRYLGEEHVPDLSIPIDVPEIPKGARKLTSAENAEYWHK